MVAQSLIESGGNVEVFAGRFAAKLRVTTLCTFAFENSALAAELILLSALKKQEAWIDTSMADLLVTSCSILA